MAPIQTKVKCTCDYKCKHVPPGFSWIPYTTSLFHEKKSIAGQRHPSLQITGILQRETAIQFRRKSRLVPCICDVCKGGVMKTEKTMRRHLAISSMRQRLNVSMEFNQNNGRTSEQPLRIGFGWDEETYGESRNTMDFEDVSTIVRDDNDNGQHCEEVVEDMVVEQNQIGYERGEDLNDHGDEAFFVGGDELHDDDPDNNDEVNMTRTVEPDQMDMNYILPRTVNHDDALMNSLIDLQSILDKHHMPLDSQDEILRKLFKSTNEQSIVDKGETIDFGKLSLGQLLALKGPNWNGDINGFQVPTSYKQLQQIYKHLGMEGTQKWRLCTGKEGESHIPYVMEPHEEDSFDIHLNCICSPKSRAKHRRDCVNCGQKCIICKQLRKDVLAFEYLPVQSIVRMFCRSRTICHNFLTLWRNKEVWRGHPKEFISDSIKDFWDGSKFREYQEFWDPESSWEGPQVCPMPHCKRTYRAFPKLKKCQELIENWDEDHQLYSFPCSQCGTLIEGPKCIHQVCFIYEF